MGLFQVVDSQLGVMPDGVEGLVTEQFFDVVEVGPGPDELGGATSAEGVGRDATVQADFCSVAFQGTADVVALDPLCVDLCRRSL